MFTDSHQETNLAFYRKTRVNRSQIDYTNAIGRLDRISQCHLETMKDEAAVKTTRKTNNLSAGELMMLVRRKRKKIQAFSSVTTGSYNKVSSLEPGLSEGRQTAFSGLTDLHVPTLSPLLIF